LGLVDKSETNMSDLEAQILVLEERHTQLEAEAKSKSGQEKQNIQQTIKDLGTWIARLKGQLTTAPLAPAQEPLRF